MSGKHSINQATPSTHAETKMQSSFPTVKSLKQRTGSHDWQHLTVAISFYFCWYMSDAMLPRSYMTSSDRPYLCGKGMKRRQTDTQTGELGPVNWAICWRNQNMLDAWRVYHTELDREVGLLHTVGQEVSLRYTAKHSGGFIVKSWTKGTSLANLSRSSPCWRTGFRMQTSTKLGRGVTADIFRAY